MHDFHLRADINIVWLSMNATIGIKELGLSRILEKTTLVLLFLKARDAKILFYFSTIPTNVLKIKGAKTI